MKNLGFAFALAIALNQRARLFTRLEANSVLLLAPSIACLQWAPPPN